MIRAQDLKGVVAMMPAFTTKDGDSPDATDTVDAVALRRSVDKMIRDGANAIATMGSFGEFHTLLWEEKKKLYDAMLPYLTTGRYVNYLGEDEGEDAVAAAYGPNYQRLRALKAKYDPTNLFHLKQNIRPS